MSINEGLRAGMPTDVHNEIGDILGHAVEEK
jgi:hypothetical protein